MRIVLIYTAVFALLSSAGGVDAGAQDFFESGKRDFNAGRYQKAYDQLFNAFKLDPGNPEINFFLGRAAFEAMDYEAAVMAFERVLIAQPEAARVKLELGRCYFHLRAYETARQLFQEVLDTNPPAAVRKNIENFLAAVDAAETRHIFSGLFSVGMTWDDNVRVSPADERISTIIGDVTLVGDSAKAQNDRIGTVTALVNHIYRFRNEGMRWKTNGLTYNGYYQFEDDLDQNFLSLTTGPEFQIGNALIELQGVVNELYLESDRYLGTMGFGSTASYPLSPRLLFTFGLLGQRKDFYQDESRDAFNLTAAGNSFFLFAPNRIGLGIAGEIENADSSVHTYSRYRVSLRYDRILPYDFNVFAGFRFQKTGYTEKEPLFAENRSDDLKEITAGFSKTLWRSGDSRRMLTAFFSYTYTKSDSNIDLYTYDKNVLIANLELRF